MKGASKAKAKENDKGKKKDTNGSKSSIPKKRPSSGGKGKGKATAGDKDEEGESDISFDEDDEEEEEGEDFDQVQRNQPPLKRGGPSRNGAATQTLSDEYEEIDIYASDLEDSDSEVTYDWSHSMREEPRAKRRRKSSDTKIDAGRTQSKYRMNIVKEGGNEVMVLSSD